MPAPAHSSRGVGMTTIDVQLRAEWLPRVGYRYDVLLDGETIVHRSRDPEYDAARVLHARGLSGRFRTMDFFTGETRMILDIAKAAKLRTVERDEGGLVTVPYRPLSDEVRTALSARTSCQGRQIADGAALDPPDRAKPAGGEACAGARRVPEDA